MRCGSTSCRRKEDEMASSFKWVGSARCERSNTAREVTMLRSAPVGDGVRDAGGAGRGQSPTAAANHTAGLHSSRSRGRERQLQQGGAAECGGEGSSCSINGETNHREVLVRRKRKQIEFISFPCSLSSYSSPEKRVSVSTASGGAATRGETTTPSCSSFSASSPSSCSSFSQPSDSSSSSSSSSSYLSSSPPSLLFPSFPSSSCSSSPRSSFHCSSSCSFSFFPETPSFAACGGGRRGYLFDPISDAPETEPQAVAKLDELAMVQLKTVLLPADLRLRLEQLLLHAGRKKDLEKMGRLLVAKYTARTSVELPRVLPSQLFAAAAHCTRSAAEEEQQEPAATSETAERGEQAGGEDGEYEEGRGEEGEGRRGREGKGLSLSEEVLLQQEALAMAEDKRHRLFRKLAGSYSPLTAAAYTAHRYAGVYSSLLRILHEIKVRAPDFVPEHVLEMHAGFAAGLAAAARVWALPSTDAGRACSSQAGGPPAHEAASTEQRDTLQGYACPGGTAAWWAAATAAAASPGAASGTSQLPSAGSLSDQTQQERQRSRRQIQQREAQKSSRREEEREKKSVFKFLLAVERSPHLTNVGKFLTADLSPPVQWQMGLYEEGVGILTPTKEDEGEAEVAAPASSAAAATSTAARGSAAKDSAAAEPIAATYDPTSSSVSTASSFASSLLAPKMHMVDRRRCFDLILLPHCLLSSADGWESMQQQVRLLWNRLARGGVLVLLERGTPTGFRALHAVREMFIRELGVGKFHFISPCPHESICPLALTGRDWCHFSQRVHRLPHHVYCKGSRAKNVEEEKFSFLVIRKMPGPRSRYACEADCPTPEERSYFWPRLVMPVIKAGKHCLLDLCAAPHAFERVAVSKSMPHTAGYKCARKAAWGDLWRFPRRIIRPDARSYTDEEVRRHLLRLRRATRNRLQAVTPDSTRCDRLGVAGKDDLEAELVASFGG